jgi:excinuclease UvrABC nuclease subunit
MTPATINPRRLPSVPMSDRRLLPEDPGIYFAIDSLGVIQYIGKSVNLRRRWEGHHRLKQLKNVGDIKIAWLTVSDAHLLPAIEEALIDRFNPRLNRCSTWFLTDNPLKWRMSELMARYRISSKEMAEALGKTTSTVSHMKNCDTMPRIDGKEFAALCYVFSRLASDKEGRQIQITPFDLLVYKQGKS